MLFILCIWNNIHIHKFKLIELSINNHVYNSIFDANNLARNLLFIKTMMISCIQALKHPSRFNVSTYYHIWINNESFYYHRVHKSKCINLLTMLLFQLNILSQPYILTTYEFLKICEPFLWFHNADKYSKYWTYVQKKLRGV